MFKTDSVKTGDDSQMLHWSLMFAGAGGAIVLLAMKERKRRKVRAK